MKRIFLSVMLFAACSLNIPAQVADGNYVRTRTFLHADGTSFLDNLVYHDGLGRPFLTLRKGITPDGNHLAVLQEYDAAGRDSLSWLPVKSTADFLAPSEVRSSAREAYGDSHPYNRTEYDASPLGRVSRTYGPGSAWQEGHPIQTEYLTNSSETLYQCTQYIVNESDGSLAASGNYAAGELHVQKTTDEDGRVSLVFTDKQGRTLLERQTDGTVSYDTYRVYDIYGNLCYVLQPQYQHTPDASLYAFQYRYDARNRCIWKKLPGASPVEYVYDDADRLTFSQDGNQRGASRWTYYLYDNLGRLTEQGECLDRDLSSDKSVWLKNYYDDYGFRGQSGFDNAAFPAGTVSAQSYLTGQELSVTGSSAKLYTAHYYDLRGRVTKTVQSNLLGGYDVTETAYTFTDNPATVTHTHSVTGQPGITEVYTYTYDAADRLSKVQHKLGSSAQVTLADYTYDDLGRLQGKSLHGSPSNRQTYSYNLRGWLTGISGGKFSQQLYYTTGSGTPCYNGNISSMTWTVGNETLTRGYRFAYDGVNRMLDAVYGEGAGLGTNQNRFTEKVTGYDANGNIFSLQRYGQTGTSSYGLIDNLTFTLNGNQLNRVDDAVTGSAYNNGFEFKDAVKQANEYAYDANGNLTKDLNKNISNIQYNSLNSPRKVTFTDGSTIEYTYAADGTKLKVVHKIGSTTTTTDYCGNVIYENGMQKLLLTETGYLTLSDSKYHYYLQDHQGNNRVVIDQNGTVEETNHYYPFGGVFASTSSIQPYKYNGKELDTKKGLNWYDYGARHYDAAMGRFTAMDRFAEKYYHLGPYQYTGNNPVNGVDVNGDSIVTTLTTQINGTMMNIDYTYRMDAQGQYGFFDTNGSMYSGDDPFMNALLAGLAQLRKGVVGNALVGELVNASRKVNIANRSRNGADPNGTYIQWNLSNAIGGLDINGNNERPTYISLGHEMAHIQDIWRGSYDGSTWFVSDDDKVNVPNAEKYATHVENQIRAKHKLPLRAYYTSKKYSKASLLFPKTRASRFYKEVKRLGNVLIPTTPYIY